MKGRARQSFSIDVMLKMLISEPEIENFQKYWSQGPKNETQARDLAE